MKTWHKIVLPIGAAAAAIAAYYGYYGYLPFMKPKELPAGNGSSTPNTGAVLKSTPSVGEIPISSLTPAERGLFNTAFQQAKAEVKATRWYKVLNGVNQLKIDTFFSNPNAILDANKKSILDYSASTNTTLKDVIIDKSRAAAGIV